MKNKRGIYLLSILTILSIVLSMNLILAQAITTPIAGTNVTGTLPITVTVQGNGVNNMTNVTCFYNSTGGAATVLLVAIANTTAGQTSFTSSPSVTAFTKTITYNISCDIRNDTTLNKTLSVYPVGIYTSNPSCLNYIDHPTTTYQDANGVKVTDESTKDALATLAYSYSLYSPDGTVSQTSTSTSPTFSGSDFSMKGTAIISSVITDSLGNVASCTNQSIFVKGDDDTSTVAVTTTVQNQETQTQNNRNRNLILLAVAVFVVMFIIILAVVLIETSKKKRR